MSKILARNGQQDGGLIFSKISLPPLAMVAETVSILTTAALSINTIYLCIVKNVTLLYSKKRWMKNKYLSHCLSHGLVAAWVQYGAYHPGDEGLNYKLGIVVAKKAQVYLSHIDRIDGDPPHHLRRRRGM